MEVESGIKVSVKSKIDSHLLSKYALMVLMCSNDQYTFKEKTFPFSLKCFNFFDKNAC